MTSSWVELAVDLANPEELTRGSNSTSPDPKSMVDPIWMRTVLREAMVVIRTRTGWVGVLLAMFGLVAGN